MAEQTTSPPGDPEYYKGARLYQQGRLDEAERELRKGIEDHREKRNGEEHPWCHSLLGAIIAQRYESRQKLDEAEDHLWKAAEAPSCDYTDPGIVRNLAVFLLEKKRDLAEAERVLRRGLSKREHPELSAILGHVLESQHRLAEAKEAYGGAISRSWPALAVVGFWRTSCELPEKPIRRRWIASQLLASALFLLLLLGGTTLGESIGLDALPLFAWTGPMQIALLVAIFLPWVLPELWRRPWRVSGPGFDLQMGPGEPDSGR